MSNSYIVDMSINCGDKEEIRNDLQIMMTTMTHITYVVYICIDVGKIQLSRTLGSH